MHIDVEGQMLPIRPHLAGALEEAWSRLSRPGTWWTGAERMAIAEQVRQARSCELCQRRKTAPSPYTVPSRHDSSSGLSADAVEAVHRLATGAGRITESWVRGLAEGPLGEERFVEIVGVVAVLTGLDTFDHALGRPLGRLVVGQRRRLALEAV